MEIVYSQTTESDLTIPFRNILNIAGADLTDPHLEETPKRLAKMYLEIFSKKIPVRYTLFPNPSDGKETHSQMILLENISFTSWCSHHLLPFVGIANIAYIPKGYLVGLSKIPYCVDYHANNPQVQERLTEDIGNELWEKISPQGLIVHLVSQHDCVSCRGVRKQNVAMQTCKIWGNIDKNEFFNSLGRKHD